MASKFISAVIFALTSIAAVSALTVREQCHCPVDNNGNTGALINVFPAYQCAYPGGACTWDEHTGVLANPPQGNCPSSAPCPSTGCVCPKDRNGDSGVLINRLEAFQCAYAGGACTWNVDGALVNTAQTNCPGYSKCQ